MSHKVKKWILKRPDKELVEKITSNLGISRIITHILVNRGIKTLSEARKFLNPDILDMYSPFLLPDMGKAVERVKQAIKNKEKILIYGDRDVDGITSVGIVKRFLSSLGGKVVYYVPSGESYGLHKDILKRYKEEGVKLIITVDCGINAKDEITYARDLGMEVVVTDHHQPLEVLPEETAAIVNPKRKDSLYPFKEISGSLVAFKLCQALLLSERIYYNDELIVVDVKKHDTHSHQTRDGIIEIGAVKLKNGLVVDIFSNVGGLNNNSLNKVLEEFFAFAKKNTLIVYDAKRSFQFLKKIARENLGKELKNPIIDVLTMTHAHPHFNFHNLLHTVESYMHKDMDGCANKTRSVASQNHAPEYVVRDLVFEHEESFFESLGITKGKYSLQLRHDLVANALSITKIFYKLFEMSDFKMGYFIQEYIDLATLGIIADFMPLIDENRTIVKYGIQRLGRTEKQGLQAILKKCNISSREVTIGDINWCIAPLLNAAGRMGEAYLGVELLLTDEKERAQSLLNQLDVLNEQRKEWQKQSLDKITSLIPHQCNLDEDKMLVVTAQGLEKGVVSIVASRLFKEYNRPIIILHIDGEEATGSARSIESFDLTWAFQECDNLLIRYGGHRRAAGLTISKDKISEFKERMKKIAQESIDEEKLVPKLEIDTQIDVSFPNIAFVQELNQLKPYGVGNPPPIFIVENISVKNCNLIEQKKEHLFLKIGNNGNIISAVGWGMGSKKEEISQIDSVDLAFRLELNTWKEKESVRLLLEDVKPSQERQLTVMS